MSAEKPSVEEQIHALQQALAHARSENYVLRAAIDRVSKGEWEEALALGHSSLMHKIQRQRWAINAIQWRGWEPEYVIDEQTTPEDYYAEAS